MIIKASKEYAKDSDKYERPRQWDYFQNGLYIT